MFALIEESIEITCKNKLKSISYLICVSSFPKKQIKIKCKLIFILSLSILFIYLSLNILSLSCLSNSKTRAFLPDNEKNER
jgi:hypothetical protein